MQTVSAETHPEEHAKIEKALAAIEASKPLLALEGERALLELYQRGLWLDRVHQDRLERALLRPGGRHVARLAQPHWREREMSPQEATEMLMTLSLDDLRGAYLFEEKVLPQGPEVVGDLLLRDRSGYLANLILYWRIPMQPSLLEEMFRLYKGDPKLGPMCIQHPNSTREMWLEAARIGGQAYQMAIQNHYRAREDRLVLNRLSGSGMRRFFRGVSGIPVLSPRVAPEKYQALQDAVAGLAVDWAHDPNCWATWENAELAINRIMGGDFVFDGPTKEKLLRIIGNPKAGHFRAAKLFCDFSELSSAEVRKLALGKEPEMDSFQLSLLLKSQLANKNERETLALLDADSSKRCAGAILDYSVPVPSVVIDRLWERFQDDPKWGSRCLLHAAASPRIIREAVAKGGELLEAVSSVYTARQNSAIRAILLLNATPAIAGHLLSDKRAWEYDQLMRVIIAGAPQLALKQFERHPPPPETTLSAVDLAPLFALGGEQSIRAFALIHKLGGGGESAPPPAPAPARGL
jgi:hypothetical protein